MKTKKKYRIALNADVGEEAGNDHLIMPYLSWCNIACGAHAGSQKVIEETIALAQKYGVKIGAHPSYPDRENFGRKRMELSYKELMETLTDQIEKVKIAVEKAGAKLHHVKPHGALYNDAAKDEEVASAVLESVKNVAKSSAIIVPHNSIISYVCKGVLGVKHEGFADRNYEKDLTLVSRSKKNALLTDPEKIFKHVFLMISQHKVKVVTGEMKPLFCDTICVHGDHPKTPEILKCLKHEFEKYNIRIL